MPAKKIDVAVDVLTGLRDYGFKWLQSLTHIWIDRQRCPKAYAEFTDYHADVDKNGEITSSYPEGQTDHLIACVRYAMEEVYKRKGL